MQFARRDRAAAGPTSPAREFRDEVVALARGLIAAGIEPGDRVGADEPDALRVDADRLRDLGGRRGHRADLRDLQRRAGRAGSSPTPARSPASSRPTRTRRWSPASATSCPTLRPRLADRRAATLDELVASAAPTVDAGRGRASAGAASARRRPRHDHLHQRHHRPAQGLRADPPQHATPTSPTRSRAAPTCSTRARRRCCSCRWRTRFARLIQIGVVQARATHRRTPPTSRTWSTTCRRSGRRSCSSVPRVFEKVYNARQAAGARRRQGRDLRPGRAGRDRLQRGAGRPGGPGLALRLQHALFDRLVYGKLRAALGGRCRDAISGGAPLGARLGALLPRHRRHRLRGVRADRDLARRRRQPAATRIRIGTVGRPLPGVTVRIADDGEILVKGEHRLPGLLEQRRRRPPRRSTPTAGSTPATSASSTTTAT